MTKAVALPSIGAKKNELIGKATTPERNERDANGGADSFTVVLESLASRGTENHSKSDDGARDQLSTASDSGGLDPDRTANDLAHSQSEHAHRSSDRHLIDAKPAPTAPSDTQRLTDDWLGRATVTHPIHSSTGSDTDPSSTTSPASRSTTPTPAVDSPKLPAGVDGIASDPTTGALPIGEPSKVAVAGQSRSERGDWSVASTIAGRASNATSIRAGSTAIGRAKSDGDVAHRSTRAVDVVERSGDVQNGSRVQVEVHDGTSLGTPAATVGPLVAASMRSSTRADGATFHLEQAPTGATGGNATRSSFVASNSDLTAALSRPRHEGDGSYAVTALLHPPSLGRVAATIKVDGDSVEVAITAHTPEGHEVLSSHLDELRQELADHHGVVHLSLDDGNSQGQRRQPTRREVDLKATADDSDVLVFHQSLPADRSVHVIL